MDRANPALPISCSAAPVRGTVRPPGSKSITNRALVCAALARGRSRLSGVLDSQDTRVMAAGLAALGIKLHADWDAGIVDVVGAGGSIPATTATIDCAASGTTMRFLSAVCSLGSGTYRLDGTARMRQRPIDDLLEPLRGLGIDALAESPGGCPPVVIRSRGLPGGRIAVRGTTSSQFASGLALAAPCAAAETTIEFTGRLVSLPYLEMTRRVMDSFGGRCTAPTPSTWVIPATGYTGCGYAIEPDASAASYFLAAAAITGGRVRVDGLSRASMQGDVAFADALQRMGCAVTWQDPSPAVPQGAVEVSGRAERGIDIDMNAISDTVPTLAAVAVYAATPTAIRNVAHIRDKETDRIGDLVRELRRLGCHVDERPDGLTIHPRPLQGARVATYDDHRMAMSLALIGLRTEAVVIENPDCVGKTFPGYWRMLEDLRTGRCPPPA
ncbi:MAG: 3-phosphoshikimate 1-carboxyvinyltransferase [Planctomycetia bacterium]|jgi:3-phosphoshikimate 1-carboxyvinyltransferase